MPRQLPTIFLLALLSTLPAAAATAPYLVSDINPFFHSGDSGPAEFITLGDVALFQARDEAGYELWRSDGTAAGTYLLADHCAGACGSEIHFFPDAGDQAFYEVRIDGEARALWVTGGTPATTFRLTETELTSLDGPAVWVGPLTLFFFFAFDADHGGQLWRSDGTPAGTYPVTRLQSGFDGPPQELIEFEGRAFFRADDGHGPSLWSSDGTPAGTRLVFTPRPTSASYSGPQHLTVAGSSLMFTAPAAGRGIELWRTDGTTRGTSLLKDLKPGPGSPEILDVRRLGRRAYFVADIGRGQELWVSDGTAAGTRQLTNLPLKKAFFGETYAFFLPTVTLPNGRMAFAVNDGPHGIEPWITDGSPAGTRLLREICPGACSMTEFAEMGFWLGQGRIWFFGDNGTQGDELWSTDGTGAGTRLLRDICPGACSSYPLPLATLKGRLLFAASDGAHGFELWQTGAGARGAIRLSDTERFSPLGYFDGATLPGVFLFSASDSEHGNELWKTDGTRAGTGLVRDIAGVDFGGSRPEFLQTAGGKLYFFADDGVHGNELWTSDGTAAGTHLIGDLAPGPQSFLTNGGPVQSADLNGVLLVLFPDEDLQMRLWRSDGSEAGTFPLASEDLRIDWKGVHVAGGTAYFVADDGVHGFELWKTDGTPAGTSRVGHLLPGSSGSRPDELTAFGGDLFFVADIEGLGRGLWRSDGTPAGTRPAHEDLGSVGRILGEHKGRLYFTAETPEEGLEPWSTDGAPTGARLLIDLVPGLDSLELGRVVSMGNQMFLTRIGFGDSPGLWSSDGTAERTRALDSPSVALSPFAVLGSFLYYTSFNQEYPGDLWRSDGTEAGTAPVLDQSGQKIVTADLVPCGSHLYFQRNGVLWRTDGTPEGTQDVPGAPGVFEVRRAGSRLFFQGHDPVTGFELWAVDGC